MSTSAATLRRLAWVLVGLFALASSTRIAVELGGGSADGPDAATTVGDVVVYLVVASLPLTALVILRRQPRNRIGWLLMGTGWVWGFAMLMDSYARYAMLVDPGSLPRPDIAATFNAVVWAPGLGLLGTFLVLLFPDGRLPSPRWRPVAWLSAGTIVGLTLSIQLSPGKLEVGPAPRLENPLAVHAFEPVLAVLMRTFLVLLPICMACCAVGALHRLRRSTGVERQQMKWLTMAGAAVATMFVLSGLVPWIYRTVTSTAAVDTGWTTLADSLSLLTFLLLPIAIAVAVLRHNLYGIDVVINRTLVYGSLTLTLAGLYVGSVLLLQLLLRPLTSSSDLAVAASTLAVAALFRPVRERIQSAVDRRFYRSRYDAERTLDAFALRLRHELDLDALTADLRATVDETVHPAHVSIWLRP